MTTTEQVSAEVSLERDPTACLPEPVLRRIFEYAIVPPPEPFAATQWQEIPRPSEWSKAAKLEAERLTDDEARRTQTWAWSLLGRLGREIQVRSSLQSFLLCRFVSHMFLKAHARVLPVSLAFCLDARAARKVCTPPRSRGRAMERSETISRLGSGALPAFPECQSPS